MRRRAALAALAALTAPVAAVGLSACGFQLRQAPALPFRRIALVGFAPRSPLAEALRRMLAGRGDGVEVVEAPARAEVVLQALEDRRERAVVATTATGQVRELELRVRLGFRLTTPAGRLLIPPTELLLEREMSFSESTALAKAQEEDELLRAMQGDIVDQLVRRLAAVRL